MHTPFRLAFGSKSRSGKDTSVDYIKTIYPDAIVLRFATNLYKITSYIQTTLNLPVCKNPALLQACGENIRHIYGDDIFASATLSNLDPDKSYIIADLRHKSEYMLAKAAGFTCIRINRQNRVIDRDPAHISEIDLDTTDFDYTIDNNGLIADLYVNIDIKLNMLGL
jgi:hypothetical protein